MKRRRETLPFVAGLLVCGAAATVELWALRASNRRVVRLGAELEVRRADLAALARRSPPLDRQTIAALDADIEVAERLLAALRAGLPGASFSPLAVPAQARESYFTLNAAVGRMRALAERHGVRIGAQERFGFASYARNGPAHGFIGPVHRQQRWIEELTGCLFASRPVEFGGVRRERPVAAVQGGEGQPAGGAQPGGAEEGSADDFFVPAPSLRGAFPDWVRTELFRLEFVGETRVAREFLNSLAAHRVPFLVRSVEVEPVAGDPAPSDPSAPLVQRHPSRFAVVVAAVELLPDKVSP
ncbi:MAG: hypothetical protein C0502_06655 [Opitutus sp.]|nr:hypothetical protein [Opitutus sp.]